MIRQAHTYLVSAMSGATLIAIAIAVFVVLVSTQVFTDWPIGALGSGNREVAVHAAKPVAGAADAGAGREATAGGGASVTATGGSGGQGGGGEQAGGQTGGAAPAGGEVPDETGTTKPGGSGGNGGGGNSGGSGGNGAANGGGSGGPSGSAGQASESTAPSSGGGSGGSGGSGGEAAGGEAAGGEPGGGEPAAGGSAPSPSATLTETVDETVSGVDEKVLGGTLEETGVTEVTEGLVNGLAGPESVVGHTLDETVNAVEGLLHPPGH